MSIRSFLAPSLRLRLIASFAAVIGLSLLLASGSFIYLLRDYQTEREKDRLGTLALSASGQVFLQLRRGVPIQEIATQIDDMAARAGVRILLLDNGGTVMRDSEEDHLLNRVLTLPPSPPPSRDQRREVYQGNMTSPTGDPMYAVIPSPPPGSSYRLVVVAPEQSLTSTWREILPRLALAFLGSLAVSVALAWWLASSITRPLVRITHASEEMARGNLDQQIEGLTTSGEIGRLAVAFNLMAREVGRSHRAMRDLLANVSHDLRTPLTSIQGFSGALVDGTLAGEAGAREAGKVIGEEAERMSRLVEDLLYLGRIEAGQVVIARSRVDVGDLVRAAKHRFSLRAEGAGIALVAEEPDHILVEGDPHRLAQVLDNLLDNALKHTPAGGTVTVAARSESPRGAGAARARAGKVLVSVHNTGSFIPKEELERVFERFYQVDKSRAARPGEGRGLGLAIASEVVHAHRGSITVKSDRQSGTVFTVTLPMLGGSPERNVHSSEPARRDALVAGAPVPARRG
ncbi:MAG: HAMP domain-containing histidine kinase [Chloroflexi bacterium]|nr:HAMP domain-containing histidine kinase [Chloroflexota bacterium]